MTLADITAEISCSEQLGDSTRYPSRLIVSLGTRTISEGELKDIWSSPTMLTLCSIVADDVKAHESVISGSTVEQGPGSEFLQYNRIGTSLLLHPLRCWNRAPCALWWQRIPHAPQCVVRIQAGLSGLPYIRHRANSSQPRWGRSFHHYEKWSRYHLPRSPQTRGAPVSILFFNIPQQSDSSKTFKHYAARVVPLGRDSWSVRRKVEPCGNAGVFLWFPL